MVLSLAPKAVYGTALVGAVAVAALPGVDRGAGLLFGFGLMAGAALVHQVGRQLHRDSARLSQAAHEVEALERANDELIEANRRMLDEQSKVVRAENLASVGLLAAGVAHEINNPLTGVQNCLMLARRPEVTEERRERYYAAIDDALRRIGITVGALLDYARARTALALAPLDAHALLWRCVPLLESALKAANVELELQLRPGEAVLLGDAPRLAQASLNLLLNAIQASPRGGKVSVRAELREGRVGLWFEDKGKGIPAELLCRVKDPFFTTKPEGEGTGLGLTVTQGIIDEHGGELVIESEPGRGTSVALWLQAASADALARAAAVEASAPAGRASVRPN